MIRQARPEDAATIRRIAEEAYRVYVQRLGKAPAPMIADFVAHIDQDWVVVVERQDEICGYAILLADEDRAFLDNIAVHPAHQRSGFGRALLDRVEQKAIALGHRRLDLYTNVVMTENVLWYEKLGFIETRRGVENGFHRIYMKKDITPKA